MQNQLAIEVLEEKLGHGWGGYDWHLVDGVKTKTFGCLCGDQFLEIKTYVDHLVDIGRKFADGQLEMARNYAAAEEPVKAEKTPGSGEVSTDVAVALRITGKNGLGTTCA